MYLAKRFSEKQQEMDERVKSGADEARIAYAGVKKLERVEREAFRRERLDCDVVKEVNALRTLSGAIKGAVTRRNWSLWSKILEQVKVEVYED